MDNKVYTQEIIQENPFPRDPQLVPLASPSTPKDTYNPTTTKEKVFPVKKIAVELLSTALNTRSRKILEEFTLQQSGGFQIGDFQQGLTGDLRLTPNGITARDIAGITTFAIDGTTGNAVFAGELKSGSIVTGTVQITDGNIALYNDGVLEIFIGDDGT